jgi:6-phosphofructokinase 1
MQGGYVKIFNLEDMPRMSDTAHLRPQEQWWLDLRPIAQILSQPGMEQPMAPNRP